MTRKATTKKQSRRTVVPIDLLDAIRRAECVLFVGAGLSREAGFPDGTELARRLRVQIPNSALSKRDDLSLSEVAEAFLKHQGGNRTQLVAAIRTALTLQSGRAPDTRTFRLIASISQLTNRVITTNWDSLIEDAVSEQTGKRPAIVVEDLDVGNIAFSSHIIYKIHGTFEREKSIVVTDTDYARIQENLFNPRSLLWAHVRAMLTGKNVLYVGYDLKDKHFETLLDEIHVALTDETGFRGNRQYALIPRMRTPQSEYRERQKQWNNKHVQIIDATARDFFEEVYQQTSEFKNRVKEIKLLQESQRPYMEIVGSAGSGKSKLLQEIDVRFKQELKWPNIVYVDLTSSIDLEKSIAQELGNKRLRKVTNIRDFAIDHGLLLLLDSIDRVDANALKILSEDFLAQIIEPSNSLYTRVIWGTRHSISNRLPSHVKNNLLSVHLSMFSSSDVTQLVSEYARVMIDKNLDESEAQQLAQAILELTGDGHPGLIKAVLRIMGEEPDQQFAVAYIQSKEGKDRILGELLNIIGDALPTDGSMREAITSTLCVPRGVHQGLIDHLMKRGLIALNGHNMDDFEVALLETHLFDVNSYPQLSHDPVIRHVLRHALDANRLNEVETACGEYFSQAASCTSEDVQRAYLREWLFHRVNELLLNEMNPDTRFEMLRTDLKSVCLSSNSDRSSARRMAFEIREDQELIRLLEGCVQRNLTELMTTIETLPTKS